MSPPAIIGIVGTILPIFLHGGDGSVFEKRVGEDLFVADDRGPRRIAAQAREVVLARLHVKLGGTNLGLLAAELRLLANTARAATVFGGLGRCRSPVRLRASGLTLLRRCRGTLAFAFRLRSFARCIGLLGFGVGLLLVFGSVGALWGGTSGSAHSGRTEGGRRRIGDSSQQKLQV